MLNKIKKDNKGFTIIEVLVVLAIAGLILLVVFLAVPALQRNSRNTQIRTAASSVAGSVNEYISTNGGKLPDSVEIENGVTTVKGAAGTTTINGKVPGNFVTGDIVYNKGKKCNGNNAGEGSTRQFAITFKIETSNTIILPQCIDG